MAINEITSIDVKTLPPFKRLIMTLGELPTSYLESMTYAELLMWFCNFLQEKVLPTIDNNAEALQDVIKYLEDLDLQDEVNNKLDEMAESGQLQEIVAEYLNSKALFGFDTVADMKSATNFIDGSYAKTLGYYAKNDGGMATYKIRAITNNDTVDEMFIIALNNEELIAELIPDNIINAIQIGCKTDGSDNATLLNNYFEKGNDRGLYFPKGNYHITSEIDTVGNVIMDKDAYLIADNVMDCMVHINKNLVIPSGSFANNYPKNLEIKINVNGMKKANTGIRTDKLHWAKLTLTARDCLVYGVHTRYNPSYGHAENTFDIQVLYDTEDGTNTATGLYVNGSDDIYNNVTSINTKYGVDLHGGDNSFGTIHCWLVNSALWSGSIMLRTTAVKNHISSLVVDTYETGIGKSANYNVSTGTFGLFIDFMYGLINTTFIPSELRTSYKLWDFTGLTGTAKNQSALHIMNYIGNDTDTAEIKIADDGNCPWNTKLGYQDDFRTPTWKYSINNCPEGCFYFTGNTNVTGKPSNITAGTFALITTISASGKVQEIMPTGYTLDAGTTTYNTSTCVPSSGFRTFYKRVLSKWNTGNSSWMQFASVFVNLPTTE